MISNLAWIVCVVLGRQIVDLASDVLPVPESIRAEGVPEIPRAIATELAAYQNIRSARFQGWGVGLEPAQGEIVRGPQLILTRFGETTQVHRVDFPGGARTQLTFHPERVLLARPRPGRPEFAFLADEGGGENYQIYLAALGADRAPRRLTDGRSRHESAVWSRSGRYLAVTGNARNGRDMDLYVLDVDTEQPPRLVAELEGNWGVLDWSPDDRTVVARQYVSINESSLYLIDTASGARTLLTPQDGARPVASGGTARFSPDGQALYATSDRDGEFQQLVRIGLVDRSWTNLSAAIPWDIEDFALADDGRTVALSANEDGFSRLYVLDAATGDLKPAPGLPRGMLSQLEFRPGSRELGFSLMTPREPADSYSFDLDAQSLIRWTRSELGGLSQDQFPEAELIRFESFDGREIPALVYRPDRTRFSGRRPVVIDIHGGPEAQQRPEFLGRDAYLVQELGVALVLPNVRGSAGYGKSYLKLDNGRLREDAVRDIGALLDWIAQQPDLDANRVGVTGGSYGGFMSLAVQVRYNDRIRAGVDVVGISNFVTFLENTQGYRRDLRRAEYGDERDPEMRRFLNAISPLSQADRIKTPLLVVQGKNDPRVPISESDQIVAAVRSSGVPVWYVVGLNEGHGFARRVNQDYQQAVEIAFWKRYLVDTPASP
ncbi:MAG: peptidase S9 family protein [Isosphaeraceae bacterium]|jgi:dipeptidyl aminopeptidase/acylaminoacyl peptidase|nr:MAG: peptidase S9 family protein [Isosphaeraceae bacterium]